MSGTVTLKVGGEALEPAVTAIMLNLRLCMEQNPVAFYELVMLCRDRCHAVFGNCDRQLEQRSLLEVNGQPHDLVRDVVLSAVTGEGFDMHLGSPCEQVPS